MLRTLCIAGLACLATAQAQGTLTSTLTSNSSSTAPIITTQFGAIQGTLLNNGTVEFFGGVPFALPPTGQLRFTYPQDWTSNYTTTPYNATVRVPDCSGLVNGVITGQEDCLYMDIWRPVGAAPAGGFPVMLYFPGGGFTWTAYQSGANMITNGAPAIVIYVRSRVGPFGFLALPGLSAETAPIATSGMYGIADFISGLRWVNKNIHSFGGNNGSITISGESAGAISICYVLTSPLATGLFQRAVMMSGSCDETSVTLDQQEQLGLLQASTNKCAANASTPAAYTAQAKCYRNLTIAEVWQGMLQVNPVNTSAEFTLSPYVVRPFADGYVVPRLPSEAFRTGQYNVVPVMTGDCNNEGGLYAAIEPLWQPPTVNFSVPMGLAQTYVNNNHSLTYGKYNASTEPLLVYYGPTGPFAQYMNNSVGAFIATMDAVTDGVFACGVRRQARAATKWNSTSWTYDFKHNWATNLFVALGSIHASDLPFWFDNPTVSGSYNGETSFFPAQQTLAASMDQFLFNFVANADPNNSTGVNINGSSIPYWPANNATADLWMDFGNGTINDTTISTTFDPFNASCNVWDLYVPYYNITIRCANGFSLQNGTCVAAQGVVYSTGEFNTTTSNYGNGANGGNTPINGTNYYGQGGVSGGQASGNSSVPLLGQSVSGNVSSTGTSSQSSSGVTASTPGAVVTSSPT